MYYYPAGNAYMQQPLSTMQPSQSLCLKGRPVSSLEEARAAQIDFDGSLFIFPDLAHNRIYTKQISADGNASLNAYELTSLPAVGSNVDTGNFVTKEEFKDAVGQLHDALSKIKGAEELELPHFNF